MILAGDLSNFHINERSTPEVQTPDPTVLVPLAPVEQYLERIGGLSSLPGIGVPGTIETEKPPYSREVVERTPEEASRYNRGRSALQRLRAQAKDGQGLADYFAVDAFCCTFLSVHPMEVYGMAWFDFEPEVEAADEALAVAA